MPGKARDANPKTKRSDDEYMRGGKGRKDEVHGSGIYPASSADAPADAETRTVGELVHHEGPRRKPKFKRSI
jgi:hypothetical protein